MGSQLKQIGQMVLNICLTPFLLLYVLVMWLFAIYNDYALEVTVYDHDGCDD